jgi:hypothetical protein
MPPEATVPEVKTEAPAVPTSAAGWLAYATGKWGIGGACVALAVAGLCYVYSDLRDTTRQMVSDQKEASNANLQVVIRNTEVITKTGQAIEEVGESVQASKQATQEIARDVRELREELRREK